jgi:myosin-crossreactive antigen
MSSKLPGGALDGIKHPSGGFMVRGDREQSNDMQCLWDLMRSIRWDESGQETQACPRETDPRSSSRRDSGR